MAKTLEDAKEAVYASLNADNEDIDAAIADLKTAMNEAGEKEAVFVPERLSQNNRAGRKMMQSYFKKRGVKVVFEA
ncbi:MAG: hypothetical protein GW778_06065 [Alphaproteobacteria bacterium]|nr:hypothetical protein [Alphaproteobacteria bacterium]